MHIYGLKITWNMCVWRFDTNHILNIFPDQTLVTDQFLIDVYRILSPSLFLGWSRSIYFSQVIQYAPKPLVSIVASLANFKESWYNIVLTDFE